MTLWPSNAALSTWDVRLWWRCHDLAWRAAGLVCSHPIAAVTLAWLLVPRMSTGSQLQLLALMCVAGLMAAGPDVRTRTSILIASLAFVYRRCHVRTTFRRAMIAAKLVQIMSAEDAMGSSRGQGYKETPKLLRRGRYRIKRIPGGLVIVVDGSCIGAGYSAFGGDQATVLKSKWKLHSIVISKHPRKPHLTVLRLVYSDPFKRTILPSELPPPSKQGMVVVGRNSELQPVEKSVKLGHLIVGAPGAGKSSEIWMILRGLVKQRLPFLVAVFDPKGGQEFGNLKDKAFRYEANPTKWVDFLAEALADLEQRQHELSGRDCPLGDPRYPLYVMVVDELLTAIGMSKGKKVKFMDQMVPATEAFLIYLSQARAAGHVPLLCSQLSQKKALDVIPDLIAYKTCLRVGSDDMVQTIFGDAKLYPAHQIPAGNAFAGIGYQGTDQGAEMYRSAFVTDAERDEVAEAIGEQSKLYTTKRELVAS